MTLFVSVGTTEFDELAREINKAEFQVAVLRLGYREVIFQYGNGGVEPQLADTKDIRQLWDALFGLSPGYIVPKLTIYSYRYKSDLVSDIARSDMLITHGGAGTCLEALSPPGRRKVIIAMNQNLMGNHQAELAFTLAAGKHAIVTTPDDLINFFLTGVSGVDPSYPIQLQQRELCHLLGPQTLPQDAGFEPFHQGDPKKLINYLDMRMNIASLLFS